MIANLSKLLPPPILIPKAQPFPPSSIESLMAANVHLGSKDLHPNMIQFVYGKRNGINIFNLDHTVSYLRRAMKLTRDIASKDGIILFVGSRLPIHRLTIQTALLADQYYSIRWIPGQISNKARVLRRSTGFDPDRVSQPNFDPQFTKPSFYDDIPNPDLIILLDYVNNKKAVDEAYANHIPVIAICDSDCDPTRVQYPIPANDDSIASVKLIATLLAKASKEGRGLIDESFKIAASE